MTRDATPDPKPAPTPAVPPPPHTNTQGKPMTTPSIDSITLKRGGHDSREKGTCAMEAVAWLAGEPHSDHPQCTDSMLAAFARRLNDAAWPSDKDRTEALRPILPLLIGTADKMDRERLRWFFADGAVRDFAPRTLDSAAEVLERRKHAEHATKLREHAKLLRELPAVTAENWRSAKAKAWEARCAAYAADADADAYAAAAYARLPLLKAAADLLRRACTECRNG